MNENESTLDDPADVQDSYALPDVIAYGLANKPRWRSFRDDHEIYNTGVFAVDWIDPISDCGDIEPTYLGDEEIVEQSEFYSDDYDTAKAVYIDHDDDYHAVSIQNVVAQVGGQLELTVDFDFDALVDDRFDDPTMGVASVGLSPDESSLVIITKGNPRPSWWGTWSGQQSEPDSIEIINKGYIAFPDREQETWSKLDDLGIPFGTLGGDGEVDATREFIEDAYEALAEAEDTDGEIMPEWVESYYDWRSDQDNPEKIPKAQKTDKIATLLENAYEWMTFETKENDVSGRNLLIYDDDIGAYQKGGAKVVQQELRRWFGPELNPAAWQDVVVRLKTIPPTPEDERDGRYHDDPLRCVKNGVLNLDTGELYDHSPEFGFTTHIPREFNPDADCPVFKDFVREITDSEDDYRTLQEWIGYILHNDLPIHRFMLWIGDGRNGKGMLMDIIEEWVTEDNVSNVELRKMTTSDDNYNLIDLDDSLVNIDGDASDLDIQGSKASTLKKITGDDTVRARNIYEAPRDLDNTSKIIVVTNEAPRIIDDTDSLKDRLLWVEFPYHYTHDPDPNDPYERQRLPPEDVKDPILDSEEELNGILTWAYEGLQRLRGRNDRFAKEVGTTSEERYQEYMTYADPVARFAREMLVENEGHGMPFDTIHSVYTSWDESSGSSINKTPLSNSLSDFVDWSHHQPRLDSGRPHCKLGVRFDEDAAEYLTEEQKEQTRNLYAGSTYLDRDDIPEIMKYEYDAAQEDDKQDEIASGVSRDDVIEYIIANPNDDVYGVMREFELDGDAFEAVQELIDDLDEEDAEPTPAVADGGSNGVAQAERRQAIIETLHDADELTFDDLLAETGLDDDKLRSDLEKFVRNGDVDCETNADGDEVFRT